MAKDNKFLANVSIKPNSRSCFLELPQSLARQCSPPFSSKMPPVICIEDSSRKLSYASWTATQSTERSPDDQLVYIGKAFADCLGLKEHDLVFIHPIWSASPCEKVCISPCQLEEWEILELNSQLIEQNLLEQIRVVHFGLEFPIFLSGSTIVNVKIVSILPEMRIGYIEEFTELHLIPKARESSVVSKREGKISSHSEQISKKTFHTHGAVRKNIEENNSASLWSFLRKLCTDGKQDSSFNSGFQYNQIRRKSKAEATLNERVTHIGQMLRIHPIAFKEARQKTGKKTWMKSLFNVFIGRDTFDVITKSCSCDNRHKTEKLRVKMTSVQSPRQRDERKKGTKNDTGRYSVQDFAIVDIFPVGNKDLAGVSRLKNAALSNECMAYLKLEQGSLVEVSCIHETASDIEGIVINVLKAKEQHMNEDAIISKFQAWIVKNSEDDEILLNDLVVLNINAPEEPLVTISLEILSASKRESSKERYYVIEPDSLETVSIAIKFYIKEEAEQLTSYTWFAKISENREFIQLGGLSEMIDKGVAYLSNIFDQERFQTASSVQNFIHKGSLLICSGSRTTASGSGRTSLANYLCNHFERRPHYCHIEFFSCVSLRGKKTDTILRRFQVAMEEARWRQPSIVVFDDIDHLIKQPDPVQDAEPTIQYHLKLAEGLKDLLRNEIASSDMVATILISKSKCSLHEIFSKPSGWHFVGCSLILRTPDELARNDIMSVLAERFSCSISNSTDLSRAVELTDGYLPADLETIIKRAKHASIRNGQSNSGQQILTFEDLQDGISGYKPLGLHGIELHSPGNLGWQHVGGLSEAKRVLTETFIWPMKYHYLFSMCPFRMRSGVLLYGPSGTGKTLLAGVVAKECGMNFVGIKGPELLSKYVGSSEQNVRDLFARAQTASPCILFFDEFDALAPKRGHDNTGVTDRVVNQLLTQLDGVEKLDKVFILAATSRPDLIDPALLRPGRLDKCVYCPMPDVHDRLEILKALSQDLAMDQKINLEFLSESTKDFSGADLKALLYNAQLKFIQKRHPLIMKEALENSDKIKISEENLSMEMSADDIIKALKDTRPSVSTAEIRRYEATFKNFNESRKGSFRTEEADTRVTLA